MSKKRLAIFDFCGTIANFQTADPFVDFVLRGRKNLALFFKDGVRQLLYSSRLLRGEKHKKFKLSLLKGHPKALIAERGEKYVDDVILKNLQQPVVDLLKKHQKQGDHVVIVSGAYDVYLDVFAKRFGADNVISTRIKFAGDVCEGEFDGLNCIGEIKIESLKRSLNLDEFDLAESFVYADEPSDIPLLNLVGHPVVVTTRMKRPWYLSHQFEVLHV